ncbi:MAG: hypothetical protein J1F17_06170 [Oscillospiraceae bacterium]|nr:hypothetical protein [Oscillospiraceae bacterium]
MNREKENTNEVLLMNKYHIYDALLVGGTAAVILGLLFLGTVFLGMFSMGRASVIIGIVLLIAGSIAIGNGKVMKKNALGEVDDFYKDYKKTEKTEEE